MTAVNKTRKKDPRWLHLCVTAGNCVTMMFMVMITTMISVEIFIRTVFRFSTFINEKPLFYFLTATILTAAAQLLREGSRARQAFPLSVLGDRAGRMLCAAITLAAIALCSFAFYQSLLMLLETFRSGAGEDAVSSACLFITQTFIPLGFLLFNLQLVAILCGTCMTPAGTLYRRKP